jgi:hypothetical protein
VTIATREERMHLFFASLPSRVRSLGDVTISQIDAYLEGELIPSLPIEIASEQRQSSTPIPRRAKK